MPIGETYAIVCQTVDVWCAYGGASVGAYQPRSSARMMTTLGLVCCAAAGMKAANAASKAFSLLFIYLVNSLALMNPLQKYTFSMNVQSFLMKKRLFIPKTNPAVSCNELAAGLSQVLYINIPRTRARNITYADAYGQDRDRRRC